MNTHTAINEGYVKFHMEWEQQQLKDYLALEDLIHWRNSLYEHQLIGMYDNGIGYGNISVREGDGFIISGTQTGNVIEADSGHFTAVTEYDIKQNRVKCAGPVKASSESLTHAALYEADEHIKAVVHVHDQKLWEKYLYILPTTEASIQYGTPEMAVEIKRLVVAGFKGNILMMAGHEGGMISFGSSLLEAAQPLIIFKEALSL